MKEITVMKKIKKVKKEIFQADYYKIVKIIMIKIFNKIDRYRVNKPLGKLNRRISHKFNHHLYHKIFPASIKVQICCKTIFLSKK